MKNKSKAEMVKELGSFIKNRRKQQNLTQEKMLDILYSEFDLYMDKNTLSLIERGKIATNWYNIFAILSVLGFKND